jgi:hypothetical protein
MRTLLFFFFFFFFVYSNTNAEPVKGSAVLVGYHPPYAQEFIYIDSVKNDYRVLLNWLRDDTNGMLYIQYYNPKDNSKSPVETYTLKGHGLFDTELNRSYNLYFGSATAVRFYPSSKTKTANIMITPREWIELRKGWAEVWISG